MLMLGLRSPESVRKLAGNPPGEKLSRAVFQLLARSNRKVVCVSWCEIETYGARLVRRVWCIVAILLSFLLLRMNY